MAVGEFYMSFSSLRAVGTRPPVFFFSSGNSGDGKSSRSAEMGLKCE